jgi:hypothetical protein
MTLYKTEQCEGHAPKNCNISRSTSVEVKYERPDTATGNSNMDADVTADIDTMVGLQVTGPGCGENMRGACCMV